MSRVRRDQPRCHSAMWICVCGHTPDVVIYYKFHRNPFRGLGAPGGRNLPIPITLAIGFYNSLHYRASNSLHYRASRDLYYTIIINDIETSIMYKYNLKSHGVQHYQRRYQQTLGVKVLRPSGSRDSDSQSQMRHELRHLFFIYGFDLTLPEKVRLLFLPSRVKMEGSPNKNSLTGNVDQCPT